MITMMPQTLDFDIIRMSFKSPLHISRGKDLYATSDAVLHSDTIKSAIFAAALQSGDTFFEKKDKIFFDSFWLSSAMPFYGMDYFFQRPLSWEWDSEDKDTKKITYLNQKDFESALKNQTSLSLDYSKLSFWEKQQTQRVNIPHEIEDGESLPFYLEKLYFKDGAGLYFMIQTSNSDKEAFLDKLMGVMRLLGDNGIGLQRNLGNGRFEVKRDKLTIEIPNDTNAVVSVSLYCPNKEEIEDSSLKNSYYQLMKRGGWLSSPENEDFISFRKRSIHMFTEGSVFPFLNLDVKGKVHNLKPEKVSMHEVWRDGRSIFLPISQ
jgi:CRISPR-associated protein Csm4